MSQSSPGPLDGVRIFDMTLWMVGPWASTQLGALGADVIHIEQPGVDPRTLGAGVPPSIDGTSIGYITWNMNKRGLFLDLKSQADRETAYRLLQTCDVFLVNMRPGAAGRLGMGYEQVRAANPNVVYTAITGWGETGPMRDSPGADVQCQYFTGFWSVNGKRDGKPEVYRHFTQTGCEHRQRRCASGVDGSVGSQTHGQGTADSRRHVARRHVPAEREDRGIPGYRCPTPTVGLRRFRGRARPGISMPGQAIGSVSRRRARIGMGPDFVERA